jgi:hypothetical protein
MGLTCEYSYIHKQTTTTIILTFYNYVTMSGCDSSECVMQGEVNFWGRVMGPVYNFTIMPFHIQNHIMKVLFNTKV